MTRPKPLLLAILDGWGYSENKNGNALAKAKLPFWNELWSKYPHTLLNASGFAVGLPQGTMGNSEVGHINIGAGRIVFQDFTRINLAIDDGSFFLNPILVDFMNRLKVGGGALHLMGLCSDIGVHAHIRHLEALLKLAENFGIEHTFVHVFTDGRDSPPNSGIGYVKRVQETVGKTSGAKIATVMGRYYAMDRDTRWDRTKKAYDAIVHGKGLNFTSAVEAVEYSYSRGVTDEFIAPSVITERLSPVATVKKGDGVVFFNFRPDRARQLTRAMALSDFKEFERSNRKELLDFVCFTEYDPTYNLPIAFPSDSLDNILGEVLSREGLFQLRIAETEKYAHVTFFFNGGEDRIFPGEDRALIPSPRDVATYDQKPQMSAYLVTEELLRRIESKKYDVIILNFANGDMVGHTGIFEAAVKAAETVDECLSKIVPAVLEKGGEVLITADHGNLEEMIDKDGGPMTAHSVNPVPFIYASKNFRGLRCGGGLSDIAPTMLKILGLSQPKEMTGNPLFE